MIRVRSLVVVFSLAVFFAAPARATAEPIQILSGSIFIGGAQDWMSRGFLRSIFYDITTDLFRLTGGEGDGIVTQQVLFPRLSPAAAWNAANVNAIVSGQLTVTATPGIAPSPFFMSGRLRVWASATYEPLFDDIVFGSGTATWRFVTDRESGDRFVSGAHYVFSDAVVTPEPATMLLLGTGLAALAARRRRQAGHPS